MADLAATPTTIIPKTVATGQLAAASAVLYTVPADTAFKIAKFILVNDTTTPVTATLHLCPNGAVAGPTNYLCVAKTIPSDGQPVDVPEAEGHYLNATDTIDGFASAADQVTYHISGVEESA